MNTHLVTKISLISDFSLLFISWTLPDGGFNFFTIILCFSSRYISSQVKLLCMLLNHYFLRHTILSCAPKRLSWIIGILSFFFFSWTISINLFKLTKICMICFDFMFTVKLSFLSPSQVPASILGTLLSFNKTTTVRGKDYWGPPYKMMKVRNREL